MIVKTGANIENLVDDVRKTFEVIEEVCAIYQVEFVITSGNDSTKHMKGSKHYTDEAIDIRTRDLHESDKMEFYTSLQGRISDEYPDEFDVVFHASHVHLEFDPK